MRQRKNRSSIIRQYKYSASTELRPLPREVWDIAKRMNEAWNILIAVYPESDLYRLNQQYDAAWEQFCKDQNRDAYEQAKKSLNTIKKKTWLKWDEQAKQAISHFGLNYSQLPNVIERFNGCIKAGRTFKIQTELRSIQIPFVFPGSAAIPVSRFIDRDRHSWRTVIERYDECVFTDNSQYARRTRRRVYMELGLSKDVPIVLRVDFHRPLPQDGTIKRILFCGKRLPFRGWRWSVLFQIEQPISQIPPELNSGVDLRICWTRTFDSIAVCQWKAKDGEGVLLMPLTPTNHQDRRTRKRRPEWLDWLYGYSDLSVFRADERSLPERSDERMKMRERRRRVEERWQARRRWLYRNFASWLVKRYATIRLSDMDVAAIAEDDTKTGPLAHADRNRQIAAPGDLISLIKECAQKHGRPIENYSQTSTSFQLLKAYGANLRDSAIPSNLQVFDVSWNSKVLQEEFTRGRV